MFWNALCILLCESNVIVDLLMLVFLSFWKVKKKERNVKVHKIDKETRVVFFTYCRCR